MTSQYFRVSGSFPTRAHCDCAAKMFMKFQWSLTSTPRPKLPGKALTVKKNLYIARKKHNNHPHPSWSGLGDGWTPPGKFTQFHSDFPLFSGGQNLTLLQKSSPLPYPYIAESTRYYNNVEWFNKKPKRDFTMRVVGKLWVLI